MCQIKNLTTSSCEPSPRHLARQEPYHKHPRATPRHLSRRKPCQQHLRAIIAAFVKTKTLPQGPASHHRGICQDKNLTTTTCEPSLRHLSNQKPFHKHLRAIIAAFVKIKTLPQAPASHHRGTCQDKSLTTSTCEPSPRHLARYKPYHMHLRAIIAACVKTKTISQAPASHHRGISKSPKSSASPPSVSQNGQRASSASSPPFSKWQWLEKQAWSTLLSSSQAT